jgi:hypothetical protein
MEQQKATKNPRNYRDLPFEKPRHDPSRCEVVTSITAKLLRSVERLDRGEGVGGEAAFRRLHKRIKERRSRG